jgi:hypothetical protein
VSTASSHELGELPNLVQDVMVERARQSSVDEWAVPASLITATSATPEGSGGLNKETGHWVEVTRIPLNQGSVMRVNRSHVFPCSTRIEPILVWNKSLRRKRPDTARSVEGSQDQPPAGQAVGASVCG